MSSVSALGTSSTSSIVSTNNEPVTVSKTVAATTAVAIQAMTAQIDNHADSTTSEKEPTLLECLKMDFDRLLSFAEKGNSTALFQLETKRRKEMDEYAAKEPKKAEQIYVKAYEAGLVLFLLPLGKMCLKHDPAEAAEWFYKAMQCGNTHAAKELAKLYSEGIGAPKDLELAKNFSQEPKILSAENGRVRCYMYGTSLVPMIGWENGRPVYCKLPGGSK